MKQKCAFQLLFVLLKLFFIDLYFLHECFSGQQLAQQMQSANPELIETLRRQMGGNPNDPDQKPQQN